MTVKITTAKRESYKFIVDANIENDSKTKFGTFKVSFDIPSKKDDLRVEAGIRNLNMGTKDFNIIARFSTKGTLPQPGPTGITQDTLEILFNSETKDGARALELIVSLGVLILISICHIAGPFLISCKFYSRDQTVEQFSRLPLNTASDLSLGLRSMG